MQRILNKFQGYTLEDCDCRYCLYYGGKRKGKEICLADRCVCKKEIFEAIGLRKLKSKAAGKGKSIWK